jgi:hypothetical protein
MFTLLIYRIISSFYEICSGRWQTDLFTGNLTFNRVHDVYDAEKQTWTTLIQSAADPAKTVDGHDMPEELRRSLRDPDIETRLTASDAKDHAWFGDEPSELVFDPA